jgi:autotransporter-associated beta strand protein
LFTTVGSASSLNLSGLNLSTRLGAAQTGVISGSGNLSFSGPGQLSLDAANNHTGTTRAVAGTLNFGNVDALAASTLDMNAADAGSVGFTLSNQTYNVGGLQGSRDLAVGNNNSLSVGANNASTTYSGAMSGSGGLTKVGTGTMNLSGANSYTGATNVASGTLLVNGSINSSVGGVTVQSGATLGGAGSVGGATTFLNGSMHTPGNSPGLQTFTAGLNYNTGSSFQWELVGNTLGVRGTDFDGVDVGGGPLNIQSGVTSSLVFNGSGSGVDWSNAFWGSNQSWRVFSSLAGMTLTSSTIFDTITTTSDTLGASLAAARAGSFFSWSQAGSDLFLNYTAGGGSGAAVPEPGSCVALALAGLALARRKGRWFRRRADATEPK